MNKKKYILAFFAVVTVSLIISYLLKQKDTIVVQTDESILFEKSEGWGPCPPLSICQQSTKLYYSGKLIMEGNTKLQKQLDQKQINNLIEKIKSTIVMSKDCSAPIILDYSATYKLNVNNQEKIIQFPGCEQELREIDELIPTK